MKKVVIFVSGSGTNMENLIQQMKAGEIDAEPALVICDNPVAGAIAKARALQVPVHVINRKSFLSRESFEKEMIQWVDRMQPHCLVLAGFMRILSPAFVRRYKGKIVNIHPSLLPAFPGAHGIRDAWNAKVKETGVTVHYVDEGLDSGPVILQQKVLIESYDTLESLTAKIHAVEYEIYPKALNRALALI